MKLKHIFFKLHNNGASYKYSENFVAFSPNHQRICVFRLCVYHTPSKWTFSLVSLTTEIFSEWRPRFNIASSGDVGLSLLLTLPTTHPKLKLGTGMSAWQRHLAVQHHIKIHNHLFHRSYVAQWQSVWPRNMRSSVRITGKPMVLKVRRKIERSWSCDQCYLYGVVCGLGRWMEDRCQMSINSILDMHMSIVQRGFVRQKTR